MGLIPTGFEGMRRTHDTAVFERHLLENGITLHLQRSPILLSKACAINVVLANIGSCFDPPEYHGLAHLFEHLPFEGTRSLPSAELLIHPLKASGVYINASTSASFTRFEAIAPERCIDRTISTIASMVIEPLLDEASLQRERSAIFKEFENYESDGEYWENVLTNKIFFGDHPLAHHPLGTSELLNNIPIEVIHDFHRTHYHTGNMHIVCGGPFVEQPDVIQKIEQVFSKARKGGKTPHNGTADVYRNRSGRVRIEDRRCSKDVLYVTYPLVNPISREDTAALNFIAHMIGGGESKPIAADLRGKRGLIYDTHLVSLSYGVYGSFFKFRCPIDRDHFALAESVFHSALSAVDEPQIIEEQTECQLGRDRAFDEPINEVLTSSGEIVTRGYIQSCRSYEEMRDQLTFERIFSWCKYLQETEPFVLEILGK